MTHILPNCSSGSRKRAVDKKQQKPSPHALRLSRGRLKPIAPAEPLWSEWNEPETFAEALDLHMRRHGETSEELWRAIIRDGENFQPSTVAAWRRGVKSPQWARSFIHLERIEERYGLGSGYFRRFLPHRARADAFEGLKGIKGAEQRRLAWHLPSDFASRKPCERGEILEWVRRVVVSGATDYRCFQANAIKHRYALRFPASGECKKQGLTAPPRLAAEMRALLAFKTTTLTPTGYQRRGVWGPDTAAQKIEHLGLLFGALAASPAGPLQGHGVPMDRLCFAMLVVPAVWDWYVRWREQRRGFYTVWEVDMLSLVMGLTSAETGWLQQTPSLVDALSPIDGLVTEDDIRLLQRDWGGACARMRAHAHRRMKEIDRVLRVHRDPFEPILPVLEADSPLAEYRKIADEIVRLMPDGRYYPKSAAEALRALLMVRLGLHLGVRQKNLRQLLVKPRGVYGSSERRLEDLKRGELRWSDRDSSWEVFIPAIAFKNADSSFFSGKPYRLLLPDLCGLYEHIDRYLDGARSLLLGGAADPETFFVKSAKQSSKSAAYDQTTFYEAWRWTTQRYGIYNPWTKRGAIVGLLPHGPHKCSRRARHPHPEADRFVRAGELRHPGHAGNRGQALRPLPAGEQGASGRSGPKQSLGELALARMPPVIAARGLNRAEAARYVGVSPTTFDKLVDDGQMPKPKRVGARRIYDRHQLDWCFDLLDVGDVAEANDFD